MFRKLITSSVNGLKPPGLLLAIGSNGGSSKSLINYRLQSANLFQQQSSRNLQTSRCRYDLMEFFEQKKNWGESQIRSGRSWRLDELRIKSNSDLHKLWFVLLKERNMLLTMEEECKRQNELFPNPERLDKVEESMANLETVVRERNKAFHQLETGLTGEIPGAEEENFLGLQEYRQFAEHTVPKGENKPYLIAKRDEPKSTRKEKSWFLIRWKEKQRKERRQDLKRHQYEVIQLLQRFPELDVEVLKEKYPDVNVAKYVTRFLEEKHQGNLVNTKYEGFNKFRKIAW